MACAHTQWKRPKLRGRDKREGCKGGASGVHTHPWLLIEFKVSLGWLHDTLYPDKNYKQKERAGGRKGASVRMSRTLSVDKVPSGGEGTGKDFKHHHHQQQQQQQLLICTSKKLCEPQAQDT